MFEPEFQDKRNASSETSGVIQSWQTSLPRGAVKKIQALYWREHCLECAPPECYHSCPLYVPRQDRRCARFKYGIYPNGSLNGLLRYGAEIKFRKWGKLGTVLYGGALSPGVHNLLASCDRLGATAVTIIYRLIRPINLVDLLNIRSKNPQRLGYKIYAYVREKLFSALRSPLGNSPRYDAFVFECFSFESTPFNMLLEYKDSIVRSRLAIEVKPGHNFREIPIGEFNGTSAPLCGMLNLYPENDKEVRVAFTWLDFVKKRDREEHRAVPEVARPAEKVKCVAWDLDNTLWKGILIEDGKKNLVLREEAVRLIRALDERGIIQSVVSKNDQIEALEALKELGLKEYFVYPVINWDPKSINLKRLATALNINEDSLALIDDSPFERAEVKSVLPQCRVYDEQEVGTIPGYPEFNVPVTEESRMRRKSYLAEMERERTFSELGGDYESFLRSCRMEMRIFIPQEKAEITRCLELIQRSNQLNLSTRRYSDTEFGELLKTAGILSVGFQCKDRFGDYGIVGFASLDERSDEPHLVDLVISCRVAQKMVERTLLECLAERSRGKGQRFFNAELVKTKKNGPLRSVIESLPFIVVEDSEGVMRLKLPLDEVNKRNDIVRAVIDF